MFTGPNNFGLIKNGDLRLGNTTNFDFGAFNTEYSYSGKGCILVVGGGGSGRSSLEYVKVDTSKYYQMICFARTIQRGSDGQLAGGHLGFSCWDEYKNFIDQRNCGGNGNTTLSRDVNPGDTHIYLTSSTGWYTGENVTSNSYIFRHVLFFPDTHPKYNKPWEYTRIGYGQYNIYYKSMVQTQSGDWELKLCDYLNNDIVMPNIGYQTLAGTPISIGQAGGTYNYALGNPNYPEEWTKYSTAPFTGEIRGSGAKFRYGTKFIRFLILLNYNQRLSNPQDHIWALDSIFFGEVLDGKDYRNIIK